MNLFFWNISPSRAASKLAKRGAEIRKLSEREKLIETTRKLCKEIGKPVPRCFS